LDTTFDVVGGLVLFGFLFFLSTWLLALELSMGKEGEKEKGKET
jgi:hypothetical protein